MRVTPHRGGLGRGVSVPPRRLAAGRPAPAATCQFIAGDPRHDPTRCGAPVKPGSSWCPDHHARCHRPPEEDEE
ncbi:hypothetical protein [Oceanibacterium hippocampi]|uniref:GcrA cell cycle regulator n=1 Tax=Oceanibacterium hippocampi TaxID=745714 RepID=A0A1Y5U593_9PROT|nr:hypothetical protein [Oceanibacterium hippocampi]SLN77272.1 hypothetical protein OCH7691_04365 [Oceanibacterium hippocampi]